MDDLKYLPEWERSFSFKNLLNRFLILSSYQNASKPRFEKADTQACANAILPSTLKLLEGNKQKIVQKIQRFIQKVPSFYFYLSSDLKENPKALKDFLSGSIT